MKQFWKENRGFIVWMGCIFIIFALVIGCCVNAAVEHHQWLESLSPEELAQYEAEKEAERQAKIYQYEVVSVSKYVKPITNNFGGVMKTEICYEFSYLDGDNLKHIKDFQHLEYGLTKIIIGDSNKFIVDTNGEDVRFLQLTKETFANLQTLTVAG